MSFRRQTIITAIGLMVIAPALTFGAFQGQNRAGNRGGGSSGGNRAPKISTPNLGGSRPAASRPSIARPSRPSVSPTSPRPGASRPAPGGAGIGRPGTALKPPSSQRPVTRPAPSIGAGGARPGRPGTSVPNLGGTRPAVRPNRPAVQPTRPGGPIATLPTRPNPGTRPGPDRPNPGTKPAPPGRPKPGDWLGIDRPVTLPAPKPGTGGRPPFAGGGNRPGRPDRPGDGNRPGRPGDNRPGRPGGGDRPTRPGDLTKPWRPGDNNRPGWANRPGRPNRPGWNSNIHKRPSWVNVNKVNNVTIHNQWNNAFVRPNRPNWWNRPVNRPDRWNNWGNRIRHNWGHYHHHHHWFDNHWWHSHYHGHGGWHYGYGFDRHPSYYWWRRPAWGSLATWFVWNNAPQAVWAQPVYYDYGPGGNVTYNNNIVYIGGQPVASADSFAMSAAELATPQPPATEDEAAAAEWMPLGTFAVSSSEQDVDPGRVIQLAVSKQGIISGVFFNSSTDEAQNVQGKVDPETQRVAFRIGDNEDIVVETGLGNLTQNEAAALVHYGPETQETWLLVRLDNPDGDDPQPAL